MQCLGVRFHGLAELTKAVIDDTEIVLRNVIARVRLRPEIVCLTSLLKVAGYKVLVAGLDPETFGFTDALTKLVAFARILCSQGGFAKVVIAGSEAGIGHRKVGIQTDSSLVERHRAGVVALSELDLASQAVFLQRFERRSCGLFDRSIKLLHSAERLAQLASHAGSRVVQSIQNVVLVGSLGFRARKRFCPGTANRIEDQAVFRADLRNGAMQDSSAVGSLANLLRDLRSKAGVGRLVHLSQRLLNTLLGDDGEEWRLSELGFETLAKRPIEHGIVG